jgi:hypothetical protein
MQSKTTNQFPTFSVFHLATWSGEKLDIYLSSLNPGEDVKFARCRYAKS